MVYYRFVWSQLSFFKLTWSTLSSFQSPHVVSGFIISPKAEMSRNQILKYHVNSVQIIEVHSRRCEYVVPCSVRFRREYQADHRQLATEAHVRYFDNLHVLPKKYSHLITKCIFYSTSCKQ